MPDAEDHIDSWSPARVQERQVQAAQALGFEAVTFRDGPEGPLLAVIPPGTFTMGSKQDSDDNPPHLMRISRAFGVGVYAVTFADYDRYCEATGREKPDDRGWSRGDRPVIKVSWEDAQGYAGWLRERTGYGYRLLSEAEWEYACRAGTRTAYWWGDGITTDQANYARKIEKIVLVHHFAPNPWGLYQVHGNVWEWVADAYKKNIAGANGLQVDPIYEGERGAVRVVRGGGWNSSAGTLRSSYRLSARPDRRDGDLGLRLARTF
ncbi:MAG: formylglycine-generating enzyme family protein [Candidatus Competibacterales bacterium]